MDNGTAAAVATTPGPIGKERRPSSNEGSATSAGSSVASGGSNSNKKRHRNSQSGIKSLVEYTSEVSSEDFSGPEDGEVDSDGPPGAYKKSELQNLQKIRRTPPPPRTPPLVANASPINDDEDIDLGEFYFHVQISNWVRYLWLYKGKWLLKSHVFTVYLTPERIIVQSGHENERVSPF